MKKFDLTVFKIGLEKGVFNHLLLMELIYGSIDSNAVQRKHLFRWNVSLFNRMPKAFRKQLVCLLVDDNKRETFSLLKSVHNVASDFAVCALRALIAKDGHFVANDCFDYVADFSAHTTPAEGVREIINWVNWGIELDDEVYQVAKTVLDEFLKDAPQGECVQQRISLLKEKLCAQRTDLEKRVHATIRKSNSLDAALLSFKEDSTSCFSKGLEAHTKLDEMTHELNDLIIQLADVYYKLGQAETYDLVKMRFDV